MQSYDQIWHHNASSKYSIRSTLSAAVLKITSQSYFHLFYFFSLNLNLIFRFWRGMYGRFESGVHPRESMNDLLLASQDHTNSLEDHVQHLTKRIGYLKNLISKSAKRLQNASKPKSSAENSAPSGDNRYILWPIQAIDLFWCLNSHICSCLGLNMTGK